MATKPKTRRPPVASEKKSTVKGKVPTVSTEEISHKLASTLIISKAKSTRNGVTPVPTPEKRILAMRTVNGVSQSLSTVMKTGWKAPSEDPPVKKVVANTHEAFGLATSARAALEDLRAISPGDVDVERAAVTVAGKLLSLDMYAHALDVLVDMHGPLVALVNSDTVATLSSRSSKTSSPRDLIAIITLPMPSKPLDATLLFLMLTYLSHSLIALSHRLNSTSLKHPQPETLALLAGTLHDSPSLLGWTPLCVQLPAKQCDILLTRAYTSLTSISNKQPASSEHLFRIRNYALMCLLRTSGSTVGPKVFWDQVVKSAASFAKIANPKNKEEERKLCQLVTSAFSELLALVEERENRDEFLRGKAFVAFCDSWIGFSKSADDVTALNKVIALVQSPPSASLANCDEEKLLNALAKLNLDDGGKTEKRGHAGGYLRKNSEESEPSSVAHITKLCASFARATTLLTNMGRCDEVDALSGIRETNDHVREARALSPVSAPEDDYLQAEAKMRRALDRLRRAAVKIIDSPDDVKSPDHGIFSAVQALLMDIATTLETLLRTRSVPDDYASLLDLLFVLARTTLAPNNPVLTDTAYDLLVRAACLLGLQLDNDNHEYHRAISTPPLTSEGTFANFIRCLSGAFHSLGATLYQAGTYGTAIRFLRQGCHVGRLALQLHGNYTEKILGDAQEPRKTASSKETEGWANLHGHLSRRWELLGVCYSKIGDRQGAYDAFRQCLGSYVFPHTFVELVRTIGPEGAFGASPSLKQAAVIVDRVTYMAACELLRQPTQISLKQLISSLSIDGATDLEEERRCVVGAILERQAESLSENLWKPEVQSVVMGLLSDCISTYDSVNRPIRRAVVMLKTLGLTYYGGVVDGDLRLSESAKEIEGLLSQEKVGLDAAMLHLRGLHSAEMHMWLALHAHRQVHPQQFTVITHHVQEACRILRTWIHGNTAGNAEAKSSIKQVSAARKARGKTASARAVASTTRRSKTLKLPPATPKRRRGSHVSQTEESPAKMNAKEDLILTHKNSRRLISLMNMTINLVGFVGHIVLKLEFLHLARQVCEHPLIGQHEEFVQLSVQLAHEYVKLGKLRDAGLVYKRSLSSTHVQTVSNETRVVLLLHHAESLIKIGDVDQGIALYTEALQLSESLPTNEKESSTADRVHSHVNRLRRIALAATVFAEIKLAEDDPTMALTGLLQANRLWNRAANALSHLSPHEVPSHGTSALSNPFDVSSDLEKASPARDDNPSSASSNPKLHHARASTNGLEWQIAEGMFETTLSIANVYFRRGSVREAEYFIRESERFARSMNAPAMLGRALALQVELQLQLRQLDTALTTLHAATDVLNGMTSPDAAGLHKLRGEYNELLLQDKDARLQYAEALKMLEELDKTFSGLRPLPRRSSIASPSPLKSTGGLEPPVPALFSSVLRQHIWLLRNDIGDEYESLLQKLSHLAPLADIQAEERSLLAKLTLHDVYDHFRGDMFLSSIRESVLSLPMGMSGDKSLLTTSAQVITRVLTEAEKLFHSDLMSTSRRGSVPRVREAAGSLALIRSFQSSLGANDSALLVANLIDSSANVTLMREMVDVIAHKLPSKTRDDLHWPLLTTDDEPLFNLRSRKSGSPSSLFDSDDDRDVQSEDLLLSGYWEYIREKYQQLPFSSSDLTQSKVDDLPANWTVVHIYVTEDQNTMFVCRQRAGQQPLVFSLPLKGRRETEDDEHLTFEDATAELREIIRLSDEGTKNAINVKGQDRSARAAWWAERMALDKRLKELLDSIEFCWFGAFKTILSAQESVPEGAMSAFRSRLDRIFEQIIGAQGMKQSTRMHLDDSLLECFSRLSPKCKDEELEDLVYFILDLYQFHGVQVAIAEVDVDHVVVELRTALEEHAARVRGRASLQEDEHVFLVLNRNLQEIPWESLPILLGRSVSRVPNIDFLVDRLEFARRRDQSTATGQDSGQYEGRTRLVLSSTYYILNPSGDLESTERRFSPWLRSMQGVGWDGIIGRTPSEQEFTHALAKNELLIYFGHGGGEQYIRSHKIRHLPRCAATMLWGCSSGLLRDMGEFDRIGTPYNYMLAGCPTLIANLWDVTDRDIDKLTQAVFDHLHLTPEALRKKPDDRTETPGTSIVKALAEARGACKLKYLTGAAPVVYGIPFYL
ncbi:peptidase family C50-domain-containing protein [Lactarius sanguifluus]|nr:peptidase family C50-domain-containing protein [Lactarius sanguifluus]